MLLLSRDADDKCRNCDRTLDERSGSERLIAQVLTKPHPDVPDGRTRIFPEAANHYAPTLVKILAHMNQHYSESTNPLFSPHAPIEMFFSRSYRPVQSETQLESRLRQEAPYSLLRGFIRSILTFNKLIRLFRDVMIVF